MMRFTLVSTKTALKTLFEAVENVERETGVKIDLDVIYSHDLDKLDPTEVVSRVSKADVLLLGLMSSIPRYLEEAIANSQAKVVVPLIGGTTFLIYLRLGSLSGESFAKMSKPLDFDADRIDVSKVFKIINYVEKVSRTLPLGVLRDYRNYIWLTRYWTYWGRRNLESLLELILSEYFGVRARYEEPKKEFEHCLLIPDKGYVENIVVPKRPAVALFLYGGMHFEHCLPVAMALKREFERARHRHPLHRRRRGRGHLATIRDSEEVYGRRG